MVITELVLQHKEKGYDEGIVIDLFADKAMLIVDYLKKEGHWYSSEEPYGGVCLLSEHCQYVNNNILRADFLNYSLYEIIIGFYPNMESFINLSKKNKAIILRLNGNRIGAYLLSNIQQKKLIEISPNGILNNEVFFEYSNFLKENSFRPFNIDFTEKLLLSLEEIEIQEFLLDDKYTLGL